MLAAAPLLPALTLAATLALGVANTAAPTYSVSYADSFLLAVTGKTGLFSFASHDHAVIASKWTAQAAFDPQELAKSSLTITVPAASLVIDSPEARKLAQLGSGPSPDDVKKIQARMLGPEVLDAIRYPAIEFKMTSAEADGPGRLRVAGALTLRGRTRPVTVPVRFQRESTGAYTFDGEFTVRQTDFGMKPESVGLGTVKVKNEVRIRFHVSVVPA